MPPRRTRAAPSQAAAAGLSTTAPGHTLVNALEHLPPPLLKTDTTSSSDEALTPISSEGEGEVKVKTALDKVVGEAVSKRKRGAKKDVSYVEAAASEPEEEEEIETPKKTPKKRTPKKAKVAKEEDGEEEADEKPKKVKKPTPKKSRLAKDEPEYDSEGNEIVKKKRKPKVYPKIEYDIPDVERKTTTFKGRLGYACLNTVLRGTKPDSIFCSRTCRIASIEEEGMELPKGLALLNVRDLSAMIEWNEQNKIRFMRMSSEMFPFASHAKYGYDLAFADEGLKAAGELAKKYGHRLTMHPGQFTQLGSPKNAVVDSSIRELDYQCEIMDRMGIGADGVMIIHMGGIYGDKPSTLARFKENYTTRLSENVKKRLVLENDEICYNVDDLLPLCNELQIPIIFDYHHDWINPSSEPPSVLIPKIAETWRKRGIKMKQHLSEPRPGAESVMERRAHADRCKSLPEDLPDDVDLMIEAKDKEQAVFELYRIYGLEDVIHDNLRPPDPNPGMHTKGRKSSLKKKVKETGEVDSEGESVNLSDIEKEGDGGVGDESVGRGKIQIATEEAGMEVDGMELENTDKPKANGKSKKRKSAVALEANVAEAEVGEQQVPTTKKKATPKKGRKSTDGNKGAEVENKENVNDLNGNGNGDADGNEELRVKEENGAEKPPPKKRGRKSKEAA